MNILFLTLGRMDSIEQHAIYPDLLRQFRNHGHQVYTVGIMDEAMPGDSCVIEEKGTHLLRVKVPNMYSKNLIKKGIATVSTETRFKNAIRKHYNQVKFDLVMYSTPPVTLAGVVKFVKKRDRARSYLLLKDIFPQNAVDLGMMTTTGPKSVIYKMFRKKEKQLYALSDTIGCMSQANVDYVLKHNPEISADKVEICPNCIEVQDVSIIPEQRQEIRKKYEIPLDKKVFVYGGNLGRPQGIPFLIECLRSQLTNSDVFFLIVGDGTEFPKLQQFMEENHPKNMKLLKRLPKDDYDCMIAACDVGMIFLDHRFTIPNFPSRTLAYMQAGLPVLACTDPNTDVGRIIEEGGFGWWCESNDTGAFSECVEKALQNDLIALGTNAWEYLNTYYTTSTGYQIIEKSQNNKV